MIQDVQNWLTWLKSNSMAENTIKAYEIHLRCFYSFLEKERINYLEVTIKDIRKYARDLQEKRKEKKSTVNARLAAIKTFYDFLIEEEKISYNPITTRIYLNMQEAEPKPLTKKEEKIILEEAKKRSEQVYLAISLLFFTGIRVGELVGLEKKDIYEKENKVMLRIRNAKRGKERMVPIISAKVAKHLLQFSQNKEGRVFDITVRGLQYHAEQISKKTGIYFTLHRTRHTFATNLLEEGVRLDVIQKVLGHSSIQTTLCYAKTKESDILAIAEEIV